MYYQTISGRDHHFNQLLVFHIYYYRYLDFEQFLYGIEIMTNPVPSLQRTKNTFKIMKNEKIVNVGENS